MGSALWSVWMVLAVVIAMALGTPDSGAAQEKTLTQAQPLTPAQEKAQEQAQEKPQEQAEEKAPGQGGFQLGGYGIQGSVEAGWRFFVNEPAKSRRAKWEEYQDYPG